MKTMTRMMTHRPGDEVVVEVEVGEAVDAVGGQVKGKTEMQPRKRLQNLMII